jgi:translocation and assembly module TamB
MALAGVDPGQTSLRLRGAWRLSTTPRVNGSFHVERESGGITLGDSPPYTFRLSELAVHGEIVEDRLTLAGRAVDEELGEARLTATAIPVAGVRSPALGRDSALAGRVELTVPTLRALDRFVGVHASIAGSAQAVFDLAGTLGEPDVTGTLDVAGVRVAAPQHALFLTDGRLHAELREQELRITELSVTGGSGQLTATGRLALGGAGADSAIEWQAEDFRLFSSPTRRLVLDGAGSLVMRDQALLARGELRASQGYFALTQSQGPRLADDVVVVGRAPRAAPRRVQLPLDIDLMFDFGERFRVEERGLDALLSGRLRVRTADAGQLSVDGTVNVDRGTYLAFGQTMFIDDGRLYFNGPATDPGLDITARRRNLPVQVGMHITGTAQTPIVRLVSEPPMPDNEKLSWLILGRSPSNTTGGDAATLAAAAEALIAGPSGVPITTRMARQVGLDEIGLRSRGDEGEAVALGRRLSDRVYLFLERGISAATTALIIEYSLTRELRLRAEAGDVNGLGITWGRTLE